MYLHSHKNTEDSRNMFEGYNGRRRLKTAIALLLVLFIIISLSYRRQNGDEYASKDMLPERRIQMKDRVGSSVRIKKSAGLMSVIEFSNSPYLDFDSLPDDVVPIIVLSNAANIEVRDAIRRTWGFDRSYRNNQLRIKTFFLVGTDDFMTQRILMEQNVFDDVIQVTIPDIYTFSAYKELAAMIWIRTYLPDVQFYIKTEDDIILNMKLFVDQFLPIIESVSNQPLVIGWFGSEHSVQRGTYQKFIDALVPTSNDELYYAMSLLYAVTSSAADRLIETLRHIELIEYPGDLFVTGILRDAAHVDIKNLATITSKSLKYQVTDGDCASLFETQTSILICTTSLHFGKLKSMSEYFEAWNILISDQLL